MVRKYTNALCVAIDQGTLSAESVVNMCLQHMSENDVADFGPDNEEDYFEDNMTDAEADAYIIAMEIKTGYLRG